MPRGLARGISTQGRADDLLFELQSTLAAFADAETRYEIEREWIDQWLGPDQDKQRLHARCERRRQLEREPYVRRLHELQRRARSLVMSGL